MNLFDWASRTCAGGTTRLAGIDMPSVAPAGAVINVGESGVEVGFGLYQIRYAVGGEIGVHIVHIYAVTQDIIWKKVAGGGVRGTAFVPC